MEDQLSIRESLWRQDTEERRRRIDSPLASQWGTCGLLPVYIYCLYAVYTKIPRRYFCLTPFVREYNIRNPFDSCLFVTHPNILNGVVELDGKLWRPHRAPPEASRSVWEADPKEKGEGFVEWKAESVGWKHEWFSE